MDKPEFKLIVGLGNPGSEYEKTFHNAGFLALAVLAESEDFKKIRGKNFKFLKKDGLVFVRPTTFMNESGKAVQEALNYFKLKPEEMLIIQDDSDISFGDFKLSFGRGAAGHNGIKSIIASLQSNDFWRLRLGIRTKPGKAGDFVLKKMNASELKEFSYRLEKFTEKVTEKSRP